MKDIERRSETMLHDSLQQIPLLRADLVKKRQQHRGKQRKKLSSNTRLLFFWQSVEMFYTGDQCKPMVKAAKLSLKAWCTTFDLKLKS